MKTKKKKNNKTHSITFRYIEQEKKNPENFLKWKYVYGTFYLGSRIAKHLFPRFSIVKFDLSEFINESGFFFLSSEGDTCVYISKLIVILQNTERKNRY